MPHGDDAERVIILFSRRLLERIDDFRYASRIPSRAAAIRRLIEIGLAHAAQPPQNGPPRR